MGFANTDFKDIFACDAEILRVDQKIRALQRERAVLDKRRDILIGITSPIMRPSPVPPTGSYANRSPIKAPSNERAELVEVWERKHNSRAEPYAPRHPLASSGGVWVGADDAAPVFVKHY
jgi:hypothetical protein